MSKSLSGNDGPVNWGIGNGALIGSWGAACCALNGAVVQEKKQKRETPAIKNAGKVKIERKFRLIEASLG